MIRPADSHSYAWTTVLELGLRHGDVLQRNEWLFDTHAAVEDVKLDSQGKVELSFWRRNRNLPLRRHTPWSRVPHFNLPDRVKLDVMHICDLGARLKI